MNRVQRQVGKNHPCHCGSGRKYKFCCIRYEEQERKVTTEVKCEHGAPLVVDFTKAPMFQIFNYQRPLRHFMREQGLYLFSMLTGAAEEKLVEQLDAGTLTRKVVFEAYKSCVLRPVAMRMLVGAANEFAVFGNRYSILRDGFRAHFDSLYNLSIPCLLPQIEGILREVRLVETSTPAVRTDGYDKRLAFEVHDFAIEFNAFLADIFRGNSLDDVFNRNPILHGANPRYGREEWSLVLLLATLEIYHFLFLRKKMPAVFP